MPITKSAKKALKQSLVKRGRNIEVKKSYKQSIKTASSETMPEAQKKIDKAVKYNVISKNKAARLKSALAKRLRNTGEAKPVKATAKRKTAKKTSKK